MIIGEKCGATENEELLLQIKNQLLDHFSSFHSDFKKWDGSPLIFPVLNKFVQDNVKWVDDLKNLHKKVYSDMSWQEASSYNWDEMRTEMIYYRNNFDWKKWPKRFSKEFQEIDQTLTEFQNMFDPNVLYETIFQRELKKYSDCYERYATEFQSNPSNIISIEKLRTNVHDLEADLQGLWSEIYRFNQSYANTVVKVKNQLSSQIRNLKGLIEDKFQEFDHLHQKEQKLKAIEKLVLQKLKLLTPGIQTLLARIAELTEIEKELVEEVIIRLISNNPDLGSYDKVSQVFILGKNIPIKQIDSILDSYPKESFNDLIASLEQKMKPDGDQLYFLVGKLHKDLETTIRELVKPDAESDFIDIIDDAFKQSLINESDQNVLHGFRKARNRFFHEEGESFPLDLLLNVKRVLDKL